MTIGAASVYAMNVHLSWVGSVREPPEILDSLLQKGVEALVLIPIGDGRVGPESVSFRRSGRKA